MVWAQASRAPHSRPAFWQRVWLVPPVERLVSFCALVAPCGCCARLHLGLRTFPSAFSSCPFSLAARSGVWSCPVAHIHRRSTIRGRQQQPQHASAMRAPYREEPRCHPLHELRDAALPRCRRCLPLLRADCRSLLCAAACARGR